MKNIVVEEFPFLKLLFEIFQLLFNNSIFIKESSNN